MMTLRIPSCVQLVSCAIGNFVPILSALSESGKYRKLAEALFLPSSLLGEDREGDIVAPGETIRYWR